MLTVLDVLQNYKLAADEQQNCVCQGEVGSSYISDISFIDYLKGKFSLKNSFFECSISLKQQRWST